MRLSKGAAAWGKIGERGLLVLFVVLPGGEDNPVKAEGRGKYWGPVKNPELLSPSHLLFLISSTNAVIGTTNYNNYSLAETWLTESLLLVHEVVNIQVLRRSLLCISLPEYLNGLLLCHYLDFKCHYSQGGFFSDPSFRWNKPGGLWLILYKQTKTTTKRNSNLTAEEIQCKCVCHI